MRLPLRYDFYIFGGGVRNQISPCSDVLSQDTFAPALLVAQISVNIGPFAIGCSLGPGAFGSS